MKWRSYPKLLILCMMLSMNFLSFSQDSFEFKSDSIACDTFPPPRNFDGTTFDEAIHIWWDVPLIDSGIWPQNLISFYIYKDFQVLDTINHTGEESYDYYDYLSNTYPTHHNYYVNAIYDLTFCGLPGEIGQSVNTDTIKIWGYYEGILPFVEDWNTGSFDPNLWEHDEFWYVNGQYGNPNPCATYSRSSSSAYEHKIVSYWVNCSRNMNTWNTFVDGDFFLDFDIKLNHLSMGPIDYMTVELKDSLQWHEVKQYSSDSGSFEWSEQNINITELAKGSYIKLSFIAHGDTGINITEWYIDNIKVYHQCNPPRDLHWVSPDEVMAWSPPFPHTPTKDYKGKGLLGYNIYIAYDSQYEFHAFTSDTFHIIDTVGWNGYYVTAIYEDCEPASNPIFGPQSVPEMPKIPDIEIFPNPCSESLCVRSSVPFQSIEIYNTRGELLLDKDENKNEININTSSFPSGIYFLKITTEQTTQLKKIIIKH